MDKETYHLKLMTLVALFFGVILLACMGLCFAGLHLLADEGWKFAIFMGALFASMIFAVIAGGGFCRHICRSWQIKQPPEPNFKNVLFEASKKLEEVIESLDSVERSKKLDDILREMKDFNTKFREQRESLLAGQ